MQCNSKVDPQDEGQYWIDQERELRELTSICSSIRHARTLISALNDYDTLNEELLNQITSILRSLVDLLEDKPQTEEKEQGKLLNSDTKRVLREDLCLFANRELRNYDIPFEITCHFPC